METKKEGLIAKPRFVNSMSNLLASIYWCSGSKSQSFRISIHYLLSEAYYRWGIT